MTRTRTLTDEIRVVVVQALAAGQRIDEAAAAAHVPVSVLRQWMRRGRGERDTVYARLNTEARDAIRVAGKARIKACARAIARARYEYGDPEDEIVHLVYLEIMRMFEAGRVVPAVAQKAVELVTAEIDDRLDDDHVSWE